MDFWLVPLSSYCSGPLVVVKNVAGVDGFWLREVSGGGASASCASASCFSAAKF